MDYLEGGDLFSHLKKVGSFAEEQAKFLVACVILAIGHLHNQEYIYRDLKPENLLFDSNGFLHLTDFGLVKKIKNDEDTKTFCGTSEYMAPETILERGSGRSVDWWSLGILLYELIFNVPPFYEQDV